MGKGFSFIQPQVLTILGTYRCTAMCADCCFDSNPRISERISLREILRSIDQAVEIGTVKLVVFSGGECFLLGDDLVAAVEHITTKGLVTRCVTNGFWAKKKEAGRRILQKLRDAGLKELNISTGDFHQQFVKEATVINAAALGVEFGLPTVIMVETRAERRVTAQSLVHHNREFFTMVSREYPEGALRVLESPWMPMAADKVIEQDPRLTLTAHNVETKTGCDNIFRTIVATPKGKLGFCCGLSRERIAELSCPWPEDLGGALAGAATDFIKIWLAVDGPEKILAWAASKNPDIDWEGRFAHHCHACLALFDEPKIKLTILRHWLERKEDVLTRYSLLLRREEMLFGETARPAFGKA